MNIKKASPKDIETILRFQILLHRYESKFNKSLRFNKERFKANTLKALSNKSVAYFIAYLNQKPVGFAEVYLKAKTAIMASSYVSSHFRRKGFGRALFKARKKWAKKKGAQKLLVEIYKKNVKAIKFSEKVGYKYSKTSGKYVIMQLRLAN